MTAWTSSPTAAHSDVKTALRVVDNVLSFVKEGKGKPSAKERALFAAAVVFIYGIWENYVEQLAIEIAKQVSRGIPAERVPARIRSQLEKRSSWEISVSPGWRALWVDIVRGKAVGDDRDEFGLNTAKKGQVTNLLTLAGVGDALEGLPSSIVPSHLADELGDPAGAVDRLVELRGEIVHTGQVPDDLRKQHVKEWRTFVKELTDAVDGRCRSACRELLS